MKKYDYKTCYIKHAEFLQNRPRLLTCFRAARHLLTALFFAVYAVTVYTAFAERYPLKTLVTLLGAPMLCVTVVTLLRYAVGRPRPYAEDGAGITPLSKKTNGVNNSFPSRHVGCAFVIATVSLPFVPWLAILSFIGGVLLAYVRFALGLHYPSDLVGGAVLGIVCGLCIFI